MTAENRHGSLGSENNSSRHSDFQRRHPDGTAGETVNLARTYSISTSTNQARADGACCGLELVIGERPHCFKAEVDLGGTVVENTERGTA